MSLRGVQTGKLRQYVMLIVVGTVARCSLLVHELASGIVPVVADHAASAGRDVADHPRQLTRTSTWNRYVVLLSLIVFLAGAAARLALAFFPQGPARGDEAVLAGRSRSSCSC